MASLVSALDGCEAGTVRIAAIEGEPGIGKTRMLEELAFLSKERGWLVRRGMATEFESEAPFGALIDALDPYLKSLDPSVVNRLGHNVISELAEAFPAFASRLDRDRSPRIIGERYRVYRALREMLDTFSSRKPILLALDDMHWADQATIEFLGHLLHRPAQKALLVVFTYRTGRLDPLLEGTIATAGVNGGLLKQVHVDSLDQDETARLIGIKSTRASKVLFNATRGNPFFALEMRKVSPSGGLPEGFGAGSGRVPESVNAAVASELRRLSFDARSFAESAAVVGDPFNLDLAAQVASRSDSEARSAIDELVTATIVAETDAARSFSFRHPLVRAGIYESMLPGARMEFHSRAASALSGPDVSVVDQARHLEIAATPGDVQAAQIVGEAANKILPHAPTQALRWYETALKLNPAGDNMFKLSMLGGLAAAATAMSKFELATSALSESIDLLPSENLDGRITIAAACAMLEGLSGNYSGSVSRLKSCLHQAGPNSRQEVELKLMLANGAFLQNDSEAMVKWSVAALEATREQHGSDRQLVAVATATRALCAAFMGPVEVAKSYADEAAGLFDALDTKEASANVQGLVRLAGAELSLDRFTDALRHGQLADELSRQTGQGQNFPFLFPIVATASVFTGDFAQARNVLDDAIDFSRLSQNSQSLAWSLSNRSLLSMTEGDLKSAHRDAAESIDLVEAETQGLVGALARGALSSILLLSGEYQNSLDELLRAGGGEKLELMPGSVRANYLTQEVRTLLALDRIEDASRVCGYVEENALEFDKPFANACANRAKSIVAIAIGEFDQAVRAGREAIEDLKFASAPIEVGRSQLDYAEALVANGQQSEAIEVLESAAKTFSEFGAESYLKRAEQRLRKLGQHIHHRTPPGTSEYGLDALTQREREVAKLVQERLTNREIASAMFLSQKTIETHMRNIFRKLGVSSRVEVARTIDQDVTPS